MKKNICLIIALLLTLSLVAFADDVSFTSTGGTFTGTSISYVLADATLTQISLGGNTYSGSDLGTLSFSTAEQGSISNAGTGGPFLPGGTIVITGNGSDGLPAGLLFDGTFPQGGTWGFVVQPDGSHLYTLCAKVSGQDGNGNSDSGIMTFFINTGIVFTGTTSASGTDTVQVAPVTAVPEPEEWSLFAVGLLGALVAIRQNPSPLRKL